MIIFLLCLPGSMVPGDKLFGFEHFDKVVHVILFGINVLFWGWHLGSVPRTPAHLRKIIMFATFSTIALGIALEFVQLYFIPNRSFDLGDIAADTVGSVLAGVMLLRL